MFIRSAGVAAYRKDIVRQSMIFDLVLRYTENQPHSPSSPSYAMILGLGLAEPLAIYFIIARGHALTKKKSEILIYPYIHSDGMAK